MLSRINNNRTNPYSAIFPLDLHTLFTQQKNKLDVFKDLEEGEKIGKDLEENKYYKFSNSYSQLVSRWYYGENREKTIDYLDDDLGNYINFLDRLVAKMDNDVLGLYKNFGIKVKEYNSELITGLYTLKKTYENQKLTTSDKTKVVAKIDSIILTLIDFKDKIITVTQNNNKKMDTLLIINNTIKSFEV